MMEVRKVLKAVEGLLVEVVSENGSNIFFYTAVNICFDNICLCEQDTLSSC